MAPHVRPKPGRSSPPLARLSELTRSPHAFRKRVEALGRQATNPRASTDRRLEAVHELGDFPSSAELAILYFVTALADKDELVRHRAFTYLTELSSALAEPPHALMAQLARGGRKVGLAAIRRVVTLSPEVRSALATRRPGFHRLRSLIGLGRVAQTSASSMASHDAPSRSHHELESVTEGRMPKSTKAGPSTRSTRESQEQVQGALAEPRAFLIRIADTEARRRAISVLGQVSKPYSGFPDFQMLVTQEHIEVLRREGIHFEALS
jgi:hypothetical protein